MLRVIYHNPRKEKEFCAERVIRGRQVWNVCETKESNVRCVSSKQGILPA